MKLPEFCKNSLLAVSPLAYLLSIGYAPYDWQRDILKSRNKRIVINGARQSGKSRIISLLPCHHAKYNEGTLSLVIAPTERQAVHDINNMREFIGMDRGYPVEGISADSVRLSNGSRVVVVPATDAARGQSSPKIIILDEASRIDNLVYQSVIMPMLNGNPDCTLIAISTPNGRDGFFWRAFNNKEWDRYEVRSPYDVVDLESRLVPAQNEADYREKRLAKGVKAYYSPRHGDLREQSFILDEMGTLMYRQENCCEFVEPNDQVFSYDEIERAFTQRARSLDMGEIPVAMPLVM